LSDEEREEGGGGEGEGGEESGGLDLLSMGSMGSALQLMLITQALGRLMKKIERGEFDRGFLSDAVYVIGALMLMVGMSHPKAFSELKDFLERLVSSESDSGSEEG